MHCVAAYFFVIYHFESWCLISTDEKFLAHHKANPSYAIHYSIRLHPLYLDITTACYTYTNKQFAQRAWLAQKLEIIFIHQPLHAACSNGCGRSGVSRS